MIIIWTSKITHTKFFNYKSKINFLGNLSKYLLLSQAGNYELGPGALYCSTWTGTNDSSSNRIQRNQEGLKISAPTHRWDKWWTKRYKKPKIQLPLQQFQEQKQDTYYTWPLHSADHLSHLSSPTHGSAPTCTPSKGPAWPPQEASKGTCHPLSFSHAPAEVPLKPCLNFFSGLFTTSID